MTRIVGGHWGGRRLVTPAGEMTRPTAEKVRAALASSLSATGGLEGARVLDLYAGSGALGLELVSRGASSAVFVERDRAALVALRANVSALGGAELAVVPGDVSAFVARAGPLHGEPSYAEPVHLGPSHVGPMPNVPGLVGSGEPRGHDPSSLENGVGVGPGTSPVASPAGPFDVVVADPPYDLAGEALRAILTGLQRTGLLALHADLIVERRFKSGEPAWPPPLEGVRSRRYGDTLLCYGRAP